VLGEEHLANEVVNNVATVVVTNQTLDMGVIGHRTVLVLVFSSRVVVRGRRHVRMKVSRKWDLL